MTVYRLLLGIVLGGIVGSGCAGSARADAASYIRTLFDATIAAPLPSHTCQSQSQPPFAELARFGAGQHWRQYDTRGRAAFDEAFCQLAMDALGRLRQRHPDISLTITGSQAGPRGMAWVRSTARADGNDWPVMWLIADPDTTPYLADIKVMGISLGIMLRSLAMQGGSGTVAAVAPAEVIAPWRQALDLAIPVSADTP